MVGKFANMAFNDGLEMVGENKEHLCSPMDTPQSFDDAKLDEIAAQDEQAAMMIGFYRAHQDIGKLILSLDGVQTRIAADVFVEGTGYLEFKLNTTGLGKLGYMAYRKFAGGMIDQLAGGIE